MRSLVLAALAICPSLALAQTQGVEVTLNQGAQEVVIGKDDCDAVVAVTWTRTTTLLHCSDLRFWLSEASNCETSPGANLVLETVTRDELNTITTGTFNIDVSDHLPIFLADGGTPCPVDNVDRTFNVCAVFRYQDLSTGNCNQDGVDSDPATIRYDAVPPTIPTINAVEPLDSALAVSVSVDSDTDEVIVRVVDPGGAEVANIRRPVGGSISVTGLVNGTEYAVTAKARDAAGNESAESAEMKGIPVATAGFYRRYVEAGGSEVGGCAQGGAALGGWAALAGAVLLARRRRTWR